MATDSKKNTAAEEAAKKALEAVEKQRAAKKTPKVSQEELLAATKKNARPYRILAFVFWLLALGCEVLAILFFAKKIDIPTITITEESLYPTGWWIAWIAALVLDLIFLIIGSAFWKKGNHLDPASAKNKTKFWLHNNLGIFVAALCFIPFIILALTDKNADKKAKTWATVIAAVALALGITTSIDYNPISQEEMLNNAATYDSVYWLEKGEVFHAFDTCQYVKGKTDILHGTGEEAVKAGKTRLCKVCEKKIGNGETPDGMDTKEWESLLNSAAEAASNAATKDEAAD